MAWRKTCGNRRMGVAEAKERRDGGRTARPVSEFNEVGRNERTRDVSELEGPTELRRPRQGLGIRWMG